MENNNKILEHLEENFNEDNSHMKSFKPHIKTHLYIKAEKGNIKYAKILEDHPDSKEN